MKDIVNLLSNLAKSPFWAMHPSSVQVLVDRIAVLADGGEAAVTPEYLAAVAERIAKAKIVGERITETSQANRRSAVITIIGPLADDPDMFFYGGTSYSDIQDQLEEAVSNPSVTEIVLLVDSPGGNVVGLPETADKIFQARQKKQVTAFVTGMAASAAYHLVSQANTITLTPSGEVGSVGVLTAHTDVSKMLERIGINVTLISAGDFKTEWYPYAPLTDEAKASVQASIDDLYKQFLLNVARGRGSKVSQDMTAEKYGNGRMLSASVALAGGLVDAVSSVRDVLAARAGQIRVALENKRKFVELL